METVKPSRRSSFMSRLSEVLSASPRKLSPGHSKTAKAQVHDDSTSVKFSGIEGSFRHSSDCSNEPGYATVPEIKSNLRDGDSSPPPPVPPKKLDDPYSTVRKKHREKHVKRKAPNYRQDRDRDDTKERSILSENRKTRIPDYAMPSTSSQDQRKFLLKNSSKKKREDFEEQLYKLKSKHQLDLRKLNEEVQQADQENEILRHRLMTLLKQENQWKHEMAEAQIIRQENQFAIENNAELNRRIVKLEEDTKQEVHLLLEQVNLVKHEKELLFNKLQTLQKEHENLQKSYSRIYSEKKGMISVERHVNEMKDNQRILDETRGKYEEEIKKMKNKYISAEEEKNVSCIKLKLLEDEISRIENENKSLRESLGEINSIKEGLINEMEKVKQNEYEAMDLLGSLLKMTEEVITERDVVLKKSALQEEQRKMIHITAMDYSINVGRLQEHIATTKKKMNEQLEKILASHREKDKKHAAMKQSYEWQLNFLKKKIAQQNYSLTHTAKDKRKLEEDLEKLWQVRLSEDKDVSTSFKIAQGLFQESS